MTYTPSCVHEAAVEAARAAGSFIARVFEDAAAGKALAVEEKHGHADIVTFADREAEAIIRRILTERVPNSRILGEEGGWQGEGEVTWYVDPIDGTSNFASGLPWFCVSIGAHDANGQPIAAAIFDPVRGEMFSCQGGQLWLNGAPLVPAIRATADAQAEILTNLPREGVLPTPEAMHWLGQIFAAFRGVRRLGSAALQLAWVAAGRAAINYDEGCWPWDLSAGLQLVAASGGQILAWERETGQRLADPMAQLDRVARLVVTTPGYALESSVAVAPWSRH